MSSYGGNGQKARVTLALPMLNTLGLLDLARATSVAAKQSESLSVRQTIEVERHDL